MRQRVLGCLGFLATIAVHAANRRPRLCDDPQPCIGFSQLFLREKWVQLHLVYSRRDAENPKCRYPAPSGFINLRRDAGHRFGFHPDEISQLRSKQQGKEVLVRNGFQVVMIDLGLRTGMAFETLIGER
jgi:hypothetical protein